MSKKKPPLLLTVSHNSPTITSFAPPPLESESEYESGSQTQGPLNLNLALKFAPSAQTSTSFHQPPLSRPLYPQPIFTTSQNPTAEPMSEASWYA